MYYERANGEQLPGRENESHRNFVDFVRAHYQMSPKWVFDGVGPFGAMPADVLDLTIENMERESYAPRDALFTLTVGAYLSAESLVKRRSHPVINIVATGEGDDGLWMDAGKADDPEKVDGIVVDRIIAELKGSVAGGVLRPVSPPLHASETTPEN